LVPQFTVQSADTVIYGPSKGYAPSKFANSPPSEVHAATNATTPVVTLLLAWYSIVAVPDVELVGPVTLTSLAVNPATLVESVLIDRGSPLLKKYTRRTICALFGTSAIDVPLNTSGAVLGFGFTPYVYDCAGCHTPPTCVPSVAYTTETFAGTTTLTPGDAAPE
jgi:hypothetical protein